MMRKSWEKVLEIWEKMEEKNLREKIEERTVGGRFGTGVNLTPESIWHQEC